MIDPDEKFAWFIPMIIGGVLGAYSGYKISAAVVDITPWNEVVKNNMILECRMPELDVLIQSNWW